MFGFEIAFELPADLVSAHHGHHDVENDHVGAINCGDVQGGAPDNNLQRVEIVWTVSTSDGREIGRATQKNLVEAGTSPGAWGEVAAIVAEAALEGIQGVLGAAGASRFRLGPPERVLKTDVPVGSGMLALPPPRLDLEGLRGRP